MKRNGVVLAVVLILAGVCLIALAFSAARSSGNLSDEEANGLREINALGLTIATVGLGLLIYEETQKSIQGMPVFHRIETPIDSGAANFCQHCGQRIAHRTNSCPACGARLEAPESPSHSMPSSRPGETAFCQYCGHLVASGASFCLWSGAMIREK